MNKKKKKEPLSTLATIKTVVEVLVGLAQTVKIVIGLLKGS